MHDTIISNKAMKTKQIIWIASLFSVLVVALVVAVFNQPVVAAQNPHLASISMQITPTLIPQGVSEIGSTDGILLMGFIIVLIVIIPVLVYRKK
jgi:hypothetical protein